MKLNKILNIILIKKLATSIRKLVMNKYFKIFNKITNINSMNFSRKASTIPITLKYILRRIAVIN